jgi:hypothetical protein
MATGCCRTSASANRLRLISDLKDELVAAKE